MSASGASGGKFMGGICECRFRVGDIHGLGR